MGDAQFSTTEYFCRECKKIVPSNPPIPVGFRGSAGCSKGFSLKEFDNPYADIPLQEKLAAIKENVIKERSNGNEYHWVTDIEPNRSELLDHTKPNILDFMSKYDPDSITGPCCIDVYCETFGKDYSSSIPSVGATFYCDVTVDGIKTRAVVDTGAAVCTVGTKQLSAEQVEKIDRSRSKTVKGVEGYFPTRGDIKLDVCIGGKSFSMWFCVLDRFTCDEFLLGNNFLIYTDVCIKPRSKTMVMNIDGKEYPVPLTTR